MPIGDALMRAWPNSLPADRRWAPFSEYISE